MTAARISIAIASVAALAVALMLLAGDWLWWPGWSLVIVMTAAALAQNLYLLRVDPELVRRRARAGEGTAGWDKLILGLFALATLAILVVGALDSGRFGWAPLPLGFWWVGLACYLGGMVGLTWPMAVNTHFEKTVRIQSDRDHQVITRGPYAIVRHPGYTATILVFCIGMPLLMLSGWAFLPAILTAGLLVVRTQREDRYLQQNLPGHADYARATRFKLLPGIW
jgi:protein-S-isoprenylcysteine O-methyltransferase Ste14